MFLSISSTKILIDVSGVLKTQMWPFCSLIVTRWIVCFLKHFSSLWKPKFSFGGSSFINLYIYLHNYNITCHKQIPSITSDHCFINLLLKSNLIFLLSFSLVYIVTQVGCLLMPLRVFHFFLHIPHKKLTGLSVLYLLLTLFLLQRQVIQQPSLLHLHLASFQIYHYQFPQQTLQHRWVSSVIYILYPWNIHSVNKHLHVSLYQHKLGTKDKMIKSHFQCK